MEGGIDITRRMDDCSLGGAGLKNDVSGKLIEGAIGAARVADDATAPLLPPLGRSEGAWETLDNPAIVAGGARGPLGAKRSIVSGTPRGDYSGLRS